MEAKVVDARELPVSQGHRQRREDDAPWCQPETANYSAWRSDHLYERSLWLDGAEFPQGVYVRKEEGHLHYYCLLVDRAWHEGGWW